MAAIEPEQTLAELVLERPGRARVFEELRIDYCCGGRRSLAEVAGQDGLELDTLVAALEAEERSGKGDDPEHDWREASFTELCDHIVNVHHAFLRRELPRIGDLIAKVAARHEGTLPDIRRLEEHFDSLRTNLIEHIDREEAGVFLLCRSLDEERDEPPPVASPQLGMHEAAHEGVGESLATIRELAGDYRTEEALCTSHRILLESLSELEQDLHRHIHEENNVLFPMLRERLGETPAPAGG
jgi:regulator of cell morphogenesis and NO signaling